MHHATQRAGRVWMGVSLGFAALKFAGMRWPEFRFFHLREDMFNPSNVEFVVWLAWGWAATRYLMMLTGGGTAASRILGWRVGLTVAVSAVPLIISWYRIAYFFTRLLQPGGIAV